MHNKQKIKERKPQKVVVTAPAELLPFLIAQFPEKKRPILKKVMGGGQIFIGKQVVTAFNHPLKKGDTLFIHWQKPPPERKTVKFSVIHEDEDIIVINKLAGILSISDNTQGNVNAYGLVKEYLREEYEHANLFLVHRLDKDASGLMVFAKNDKAQKFLQNQMTKESWHQEYVALTDGSPEEKEGVLKHWLTEGKTFIVHASPKKNNGQEAITEFFVKKEHKGIGILKLVAKTQRKNQVRSQLKAIGHPILGDKKYGSQINPIRRLALHLIKLKFIHPKTNELVEFKGSIPTKFKRVI